MVVIIQGDAWKQDIRRSVSGDSSPRDPVPPAQPAPSTTSTRAAPLTASRSQPIPHNVSGTLYDMFILGFNTHMYALVLRDTFILGLTSSGT